MRQYEDILKEIRILASKMQEETQRTVPLKNAAEEAARNAEAAARSAREKQAEIDALTQQREKMDPAHANQELDKANLKHAGLTQLRQTLHALEADKAGLEKLDADIKTMEEKMRMLSQAAQEAETAYKQARERDEKSEQPAPHHANKPRGTSRHAAETARCGAGRHLPLCAASTSTTPTWTRTSAWC